MMLLSECVSAIIYADLLFFYVQCSPKKSLQYKYVCGSKVNLI